MASEAGVLDIPPEDVAAARAGCSPGRMFLVDTEQGRIVDDEEIKRADRQRAAVPAVARRAPGHARGPARRAPSCRRRITTRCCSGRSPSATPSRTSASSSTPMARDGVEAVGSMGNDTPLAVLSDQAAAAVRLFQAAVRAGHQPADRLHPRGADHLERSAGSARRATCWSRSRPTAGSSSWSGPVLTNEEFAKRPAHGAARAARSACCRSCSASRAARTAWSSAMEELRVMARRMIEEEEVNVLILSDRGVNTRLRADPGAARGRRACTTT